MPRLTKNSSGRVTEKYENNKFSESEVSYRKAIDKNKMSPDAVFNVGDALYKQNNFEDAGKQFIENTNMNEDKNKKSAGMFNLGNSLLKANKVQESIEAFKGSLKLRPDNNEAKFNLAYAQDLLKQQQEQQQKQQQQQNDKDKKDQNKIITRKIRRRIKPIRIKTNQRTRTTIRIKSNSSNSNHKVFLKKIAQRLLNALANDEKNVQEKVKLAKAAKEKVRTVKNW